MKLLLILLFCALQANAQSVTAGIGYIGANHDKVYDGRVLNGLDVEISAAADGMGDIFLNARYQNLGARVNSSATRDLKYYEATGNFLIPGLNHYAVAGISSMTFGERQKNIGSEFRFQTQAVGPVAGLMGQQRLGDAL